MDSLKIVKYEVIADFPGSDLKKGEVVELSENKSMISIGYEVEEFDVRDYPHLFKKVSG